VQFVIDIWIEYDEEHKKPPLFTQPMADIVEPEVDG
jgi:hypothetical protein